MQNRILISSLLCSTCLATAGTFSENSDLGSLVVMPPTESAPGYAPEETDGESTLGKRTYFPSNITFEYLGPMGYKHGTGRVSAYNLDVELNLANVTAENWNFKFSTAFRSTWFDSCGDGALDERDLYTIWVRMATTYSISKTTKLSFGMSPQISTDFNGMRGNSVYLGANVMCVFATSERSLFGLGLAYVPQFSGFPCLPAAMFTITSADKKWEYSLIGSRFTIDYNVTEAFSLGIFTAYDGMTWTVRNKDRYYRMGWTSWKTGLNISFGIGKIGSSKPKISTDVGFTYGNDATFRSANGTHKYYTQEYKPGFYLKTGLIFHF